MSFEPEKTDVDEHIDLINTLGDMVHQKEEAKMEKFIETMPTMIQTHLIICEDWAETKDKAKSLEHIIQKCDLPTPSMPLVTTGATVLGLYSHITHSVDKDEAEIPPPFKGAKPKQTIGRGKPKGKPQGHRQNSPKEPEADESYTYDNTNNYYHNDNYTAPGQSQGCRHLMVKAVANNLEALHSKAEARDLTIIHINFRTTGFREVHIKVTTINTVATTNPTSRVINQICTEVEAVAMVLNKQEDTVMVGPINTIITITSISIILMISRPNSMARPVACAEVLIIPLSIATKENMI